MATYADSSVASNTRFVSANPDVQDLDSDAFARYSRERLDLLTGAPDPGTVVPEAGSFDILIKDVASVTQTSSVVDNHAFPVWDHELVALPGGGGISGVVSAQWNKTVSSKWFINGNITAEAQVKFLAKLAGTVGGGYEQTTSSVWSGNTTINYSIPDGYSQTFSAYEKGIRRVFSTYALVVYSHGETWTTITSVADGVEAYPYQNTRFEVGPYVYISGK